MARKETVFKGAANLVAAAGKSLLRARDEIVEGYSSHRSVRGDNGDEVMMAVVVVGGKVCGEISRTE